MIIVLLAVFGLIFGSFVNALVWRIHEQEALHEKKKKPTKKQLAELSILRGRSMCTHCHHELAGKDLVPLFSWLWLQGKCRYCGAPIGWQYPVVEAVTAGLFVASYIWWPDQLTGIAVQQFVVWLGFVTMFVALAVYDLRWYLLPNRIVYPLNIIAVIEVLIVALNKHNLGALWEPLAGALIISGLFYLLFQLSAGKWIGGGDVKLAITLGLWAGTPLKACLVLFFASLIGTVVSVPIALRAKQGLKLRVPFGPFLLAATFLTVLFGTGVINWYIDRLLG